ncbi:hypothetical protein ACHAXS_003744 [Conticribra weissflogii]
MHRKMITLWSPVIFLLSYLCNSAFVVSERNIDRSFFQLQIYHYFSSRQKNTLSISPVIVNSLTSSTRAGEISSQKRSSTSTKATTALAFVFSRPTHTTRSWHDCSPTPAPFLYPEKNLFHHPLTRKSYFEKYGFLTSLLSSKNSDEEAKKGSANNDDDECSLQNLYQQVQKEDSEWYYQTFSKLLGEEVEDPIELLDCKRNGNDSNEDEDEAANVVRSNRGNEGGDDIGSNTKAIVEKKKLIRKVEVQTEKYNLVTSDENMDVATSEVPVNESTGNGKEKNAGKKVEVTVNVLGDESALNASNSKTAIKERSAPSLQQVEEVQEVMDNIITQQAIPASDTVRSRVKIGNENGEIEEDDDCENDEHKEISGKDTIYDNHDRITEEDDFGNDLIPFERTQPNRSKPMQTSVETNPSTSPSSSKLQEPPQMVRIRNRITNQIENITPLPSLQRMGYTEEDIRLLRPQVLELIVEDDIPKPRRGIPERWMSGGSSRNTGYGEEEDEEDDDFGWEIVIVNSKSTNRTERREKQVHRKEQKVGGDASSVVSNDGVADEREEMKLEPYPTSKTENKVSSGMKDEHYSDSNSRPPGKPLAPSLRKEALNEDRAPKQVSESWGPFSSSRITNGKKSQGSSSQRTQRREEFETEQYDDSDDGMINRDHDMYGDDDNLNPMQPWKRQTLSDEQYIESSPRRRERLEPIQRTRQTYSDGDEDDLTYRQYSRQPSQRDGRKRRRSLPPPPRRRKELVVDRYEDDDQDNPPPNKFWMDLPTFRDYLRTEAKLRLNILGPDWKESVLDESRWRFDLYKKWLYLLDDGVGENPLYTYGEIPRRAKERRSRRPPPPPPSRRSFRKEEPYEPKQPRQQKSRRPSVVERDQILYDGRQRRQRPTSVDSSGGRIEKETLQDSLMEPNHSYPKPTEGGRNSSATTGGDWKNFSDLEESLTRSVQSRDSGRLDDSADYYSRSRIDEREQLEEEERERMPPKRQLSRDQDVWRKNY